LGLDAATQASGLWLWSLRADGKNMLIIQKRAGQLGNQLFQLAHFAAVARDQRFKVVFPSFEYPLSNWPNINSESFVRVTRSGSSKHKIIHRACKALRLLCSSSAWHHCLVETGDIYDLDSTKFREIARKQIVVCEGFAFKGIDSVARNYDWLQSLFTMPPYIAERVSQFEKTNKLTGKTVIGFHVRRGDYRSYRGGEFFYDDACWRKWITQARVVFGGRKGKFVGVLFSNEDIEQLAASEPDLISGPGDMYEDLLMLQRCHKIIGPPSTYSGWASFISGVPMQVLMSKHDMIKGERFKPVLW
jgi:hypothetical protein